MDPISPKVRQVILLTIAMIPLVMLTVAVWAVNRVEPYIGPFPFLLFWIVTWVFLTPFFMMLVYVLDRRWTRKFAASGTTGPREKGDRDVR